MLNSCETIDMIARDKWFNRTLNVHSHHQQAADKGYKTAESDADVSVYSTKTSC